VAALMTRMCRSWMRIRTGGPGVSPAYADVVKLAVNAQGELARVQSLVWFGRGTFQVWARWTSGCAGRGGAGPTWGTWLVEHALQRPRLKSILTS
jgi:hypothetical protein